MKRKHTLLFFISLLVCSLSMVGQVENDTVPQVTKYGLRLGLDIAKPVRTLVEDGYSGFEIVGDFRLSKKFYAAAELGNEKSEFDEENLNVTTSGSYIKLGADYNAHNNWFGLNNAIYTGLRYGFATFKHELNSFAIYTDNTVFPSTVISQGEEFNGLTAHWAELVVGIKTEVLNNLYISLNVQLKRTLSETEPENFGNVFIPGFNTTNDFSDFGVGYGYSISYLIPIFKK